MKEYWVNVYDSFKFKRYWYSLPRPSLQIAILKCNPTLDGNGKLLYRIHVKMKDKAIDFNMDTNAGELIPYPTGNEINKLTRYFKASVVGNCGMSHTFKEWQDCKDCNNCNNCPIPKYEHPRWFGEWID